MEKIEWSGKTSSFHHKWHDTPNPPGVAEGLRKVWFLDTQWSTCPVEVEDQVRGLWREFELGNDNYCIKTSLADLSRMHDDGLQTNAISQWITEQQPDMDSEDQIIIHWWW